MRQAETSCWSGGMKQAHICWPLGGSHILIIQRKTGYTRLSAAAPLFLLMGTDTDAASQMEGGPGWLRAAKAKQGGWNHLRGMDERWLPKFL